MARNDSAALRKGLDSRDPAFGNLQAARHIIRGVLATDRDALAAGHAHDGRGLQYNRNPNASALRERICRLTVELDSVDVEIIRRVRASGRQGR